MEINGREVDHFVVNLYSHDGDGIKVTQIKAVDKNGKYIKFVALKEVLPYLSSHKVIFREYDNI